MLTQYIDFSLNRDITGSRPNSFVLFSRAKQGSPSVQLHSRTALFPLCICTDRLCIFATIIITTCKNAVMVLTRLRISPIICPTQSKGVPMKGLSSLYFLIYIWYF
jgi:hypothetical protein